MADKNSNCCCGCFPPVKRKSSPGTKVKEESRAGKGLK